MTTVKVPIKVQKRSGFDWSHHRGFSQKVGEIIPLAINECIPNTKMYMRYALAGSMAPLASDCYMKVFYDVRAFFVPMRLLYGGFETWFNDYPYNQINYASTGNVVNRVKANLPYFLFDYGDVNNFTFLQPGSLADYLGFSGEYAELSSQSDQDFALSCMPFLAYHRVCDDFFRQPNVTVSCFAHPNNSSVNDGNSDYFVALAPFVSPSPGSEVVSVTSLLSGVPSKNCLFADGHSIFDTRYCNYDYDYFTNALPNKQLGNPMTVSTGGGSFSIEALRWANALQQFGELNQLAGANTVDTVRARYGAHLSNGVAQRSIYLGGARIDIGSKSVDVTVPNTGSSSNPMIKQVGSSGGKVFAQGSNIIIDGFVSQEPGYIIVVGVVVPKVTYGSGCRRYLRHYIGAGSITDMANPLLQNVGNQPIYMWELNGSLISQSSYDTSPFGYTDRYAEFMTMEDSVCGLLREGESLQSFIAQRNFYSDTPQISSSFLQIRSTDLDNISAVSGAVSTYGFFGQAAFEWKVSQPLAQYSLPSLQNPAYEHGETVMVHRGGFRF